jgi:hypothetical protein
VIPILPYAAFGSTDWTQVMGDDPNLGFNVGQLTVCLFTNNIQQLPFVGIEDLVEATFTGYAEQASTLTQFQDSLGRHGYANAVGLQFTCTAEPEAPTWVWGYFLLNTASGELSVIGRFQAPIPVHNGTKIFPEIRLAWGLSPLVDDGTGQ